MWCKSWYVDRTKAPRIGVCKPLHDLDHLNCQAMNQSLHLAVTLFSPVKWIWYLPSLIPRILWASQHLTKGNHCTSPPYTAWVSMEASGGSYSLEKVLQHDSYLDNYFILHSEGFKNTFDWLVCNIKTTKSPNKQKRERFNNQLPKG